MVAPTFEVGRFHAVLQSLQQLDNAEVLPVVKSLLSPTERETCFIAAYYRTVANARTLLLLKDASHFQGIAMVARAMFELDVDVRLISVVENAIGKIFAFSDAERLRSARASIALSKAGKTIDDASIAATFIASSVRRLTPRVRRSGPKGRVSSTGRA